MASSPQTDKELCEPSDEMSAEPKTLPEPSVATIYGLELVKPSDEVTPS